MALLTGAAVTTQISKAPVREDDQVVTIEPRFVSLDSGQVQEFRGTTGARWQMSPCAGRLQPVDETTVRYTAPRLICLSRTVQLTALAGVETASADIALSSTPFWIAVLSVLWPAPVIALMAALFWVWPGPPPLVTADVYPPVVTVAPGASEQFTARIWNAPNQSVTWSASDGMVTAAGLFTAPKEAAGRIVVTAVSKADAAVTATALVLIGDGMALQPSASEIGPSEAVDLLPITSDGRRVADVDWFAAPDGVVDIRNGRVVAAARLARSTRVIVTAKDRQKPNRQGGAVLLVSPVRPADSRVDPSTARDRSLIALVLIMGALGAFLGASRSFANFVGNRSFRPSWAVFYLFRPVFGAGLALLVFFGCSIGAVTALSSGTAEPFGIAFLAGVTGLFADTVLGKLKDLIATMFPSQETHLDKMHPESPRADGT